MIITPDTPLSKIPSGITPRWPEYEGKEYDPAKDYIEIGRNVKIRGPVILYWGVKIGDKSQLGHNVLIREYTEIGNATVIGSFVDIEGYVKIGDHVTLHSGCIINQKTEIEDWAFLGPGCITTNTRKIKHGRSYPLILEGVKIGFAARIGAGVIIGPGVTIGENALIGMGSLVTGDIPPRVMAYGHPARIIKDVPSDEILTPPEKNEKFRK